MGWVNMNNKLDLDKGLSKQDIINRLVGILPTPSSLLFRVNSHKISMNAAKEILMLIREESIRASQIGETEITIDIPHNYFISEHRNRILSIVYGVLETAGFRFRSIDGVLKIYFE